MNKPNYEPAEKSNYEYELQPGEDPSWFTNPKDYDPHAKEYPGGLIITPKRPLAEEIEGLPDPLAYNNGADYERALEEVIRNYPSSPQAKRAQAILDQRDEIRGGGFDEILKQKQY